MNTCLISWINNTNFKEFINYTLLRIGLTSIKWKNKQWTNSLIDSIYYFMFPGAYTYAHVHVHTHTNLHVMHTTNI